MVDKNLKTRRLRSGLSQEMLAIAAGLSRKTIQRLESDGGGSAETWASIEAVLTARRGDADAKPAEAMPAERPRTKVGYRPFAREAAFAFLGAVAASVAVLAVVPDRNPEPPFDRTAFVVCVGDGRTVVRRSDGIMEIDHASDACS